MDVVGDRRCHMLFRLLRQAMGRACIRTGRLSSSSFLLLYC